VDLTIDDSTWASAVEAAKIPVVGGNLTSTVMYQNPDFYPAGQTVDSAAYVEVATAKAAGTTKLGLLYCAEAPVCADLVPQIKAAAKALGVSDDYTASISATAPDYTAQCVAAQQAHIDGLIIQDSRTEVANVGRSCNIQGYNPTYVIEGQVFGLALESAPGIKDYLWSAYGNAPFWDDTPAVQAMNAAVDKSYPGLTTNPLAWGELGVQAWTAGLLLNDAVKAGGLTSGATPTAAEIVSGLESLKSDTLDGMSPPLTYAAGRDHSISCFLTGRMQGGVPSLVNGGQYTCEGGSSPS
jgi:branched-chain amino acid transport system substrate-binding protein